MNLGNILTPSLIFAEGAIKKLPELAAGYGRRALLCTGKTFAAGERFAELADELNKAGVAFSHWAGASGEPSPEMVDDAAWLAVKDSCDMVIAIGGGSVMDIAKAAAAVAANGGAAEDYIEMVGSKTITKTPLPFIACPTTSGTGSEMTKNAVICRPGVYKNSMRADSMLPRAALVDPQLTYTVSASTTAKSGADALCQLIESFTSKNAALYTDALSIRFIAPVFGALPRACADGEDAEARAVMSFGAAVSGATLANAGLGLAHGIAGVLGAVAGVPHGAACGILMPYIARENAARGVEKYAEVAAALGKPGLSVKDAGAYLADRLFELNQKIGLPGGLTEYALTEEQKKRVAALAAKANATKSNPVTLSEEEIYALLCEL